MTKIKLIQNKLKFIFLIINILFLISLHQNLYNYKIIKSEGYQENSNENLETLHLARTQFHHLPGLYPKTRFLENYPFYSEDYINSDSVIKPKLAKLNEDIFVVSGFWDTRKVQDFSKHGSGMVNKSDNNDVLGSNRNMIYYLK